MARSAGAVGEGSLGGPAEGSVEVIESPPAAATALDPVRSRLLGELSEPTSAAALAGRLGLPRQKITYHLRALEAQQLVRQVAERRWGGLTERLFTATAACYVVSPAAIGEGAAEPQAAGDRLSARYVIALAGRIIREVGVLARRAGRDRKRLATLGIDAEIRFRSAAERGAFAEELAQAVTALTARYHDPTAPGGRAHRLVAVVHPIPHTEDRSVEEER